MTHWTQLKIPALQRVASRICVSCGADADAFCARCGVTPYCSARCQRRDWSARHQAVCHNLARLATGRDLQDVTDAVDPLIPPPAPPLRRPHSPSKARQEPKQERQDRDQRHDKLDDSFDRQNNKVFTAPGHVKQPQRADNNRGGRPYNNRDSNNRRDNNRDSNRDNNRDYNSRDNNRDSNSYNKKPYERRPQPKKAEEEEECWEKKNAKPESTEPKPLPAKAQPIAEPKQSASHTTVNVASANATAPQTSAKKPGSVGDVTPAKKFVPKNYVIEMLSIGETALLSVDNVTSSCASKKPGFVCLSMHDKFESDYQALCETYVVDCEADPNKFVPSPGDLFSYLSPEDGGWYRARSLGKDNAALIDSSKTIKLKSTDGTKKLMPKYEEIPEFCCVLDAAKVQIGDNLKCTITAKTADGFKVSLDNIETETSVGEGIVTRWMPDVDNPLPPVTASSQTAQPPQIPEAPRPDLINNNKYFILEMATVDRVYVRPCDSSREYDLLIQDVFMNTDKAKPLDQPPKKGDIVVGKFTDGFLYRAIVKRTNVAQNKYLLEYIDFGNMEVSKLENLYICPDECDLIKKPTLVSIVSLQMANKISLTPPAVEYLKKLTDANPELILTISSGAKTAPSGSEGCLTIAKTKESLSRKIEELCTPDWKKLEEKGADVVECPKLMYDKLKYLELPAAGCELEVLDVSALRKGSVCGHERGLKRVDDVLKHLTERMAEYCNSDIGREPYLPSVEELCIAQCPPYPQWFRAVVTSHEAGESEAQVLYIDYGNLESVPVTLLRKMLPEFAREPALACHVEIRGFPEDVSDEMLTRAITHMQLNDEGRGVLRVTRCQLQEPGLYSVDAPDLLKVMGVTQ